MPPTRLARAEKNARTEALILAAARAAFAERGYDGASMDEVAEHAGLSKGALYYRHASKEDLFLALLDDRGVARSSALAEVAAAAAADTASRGVRAQRAADQLVERLAHDEGWSTLLAEFAAHAKREPAFAEHLADFSRATRAEIAALLEARAADMEVELPMAAEQLAVVISALASGIAVERSIDEAAVPEDLLGAAISLLLTGVTVAARRKPG